MAEHAGRVAVVTGGARGIGNAIARRLQDDGWRVVAADVDPGGDGEAGVPVVGCDVRDRDAVDRVIGEVHDAHGGLDLLVNNAGLQIHGPTETLSWESWSRVVDVNLHGTFNCLQAAGRLMLDAGRGSIVNIASISAERGAPGRAPYCATKAAICALTRTAGVEWGARGVRVNAVAPGYVDTGVFRQGVEEGRLDEGEILDRIPMRRLAEPAEVGAMVSFLASPDAAYVTGQVFFVDGGFLADYGVGSTAVGAAVRR